MTRASTKVRMGESTYYATLNQFAVKRITPAMPPPVLYKRSIGFRQVIDLGKLHASNHFHAFFKQGSNKI